MAMPRPGQVCLDPCKVPARLSSVRRLHSFFPHTIRRAVENAVCLVCGQKTTLYKVVLLWLHVVFFPRVVIV